MPDFASDVLRLTTEGPVATLWLARPEQRNAFGPAFWDDLPRAMQRLGDDEAVRAVVLAADGPVFSAGLDLKAMGHLLQPARDGSPATHRRRLYASIQAMQDAISAVEACPKPVIAAVHGPCLGAGIDLITACDVRLAARDAVFSVRETRMALVADLGTLQRLPRLLNPGHVAELVYTGQDVDAERAEAIGLVTGLHDDAEAVQAAAQAMAMAMSANAPLAVQGAKTVLRKGGELTTAEALDYVALWNAAFLPSEDVQEAVSAFFERRAPSFKGR